MKTSELRIGNLVYKGELFPVEVVEVIKGSKIKTNRHTLCNINKFRPIPLTEEHRKKWIPGLIIPCWIKHIHELQNWHYWTFIKSELCLTN